MRNPRSTKGRDSFWLVTMLVLTSLRVVAGGAEFDVADHAANADGAPALAEVLEHHHPMSHDGNPETTHVHCHNGCAHAPVIENALPTLASVASVMIDSALVPEPTVSIAVRVYRPPIA